MRKQLILSLFILFLIISLSTFISAALCKGPDGYYDDCFKLMYGHYPNYYNYPVYTYHYEQRINYDYYPIKKITHREYEPSNIKRNYNPYLPFIVYDTNDYRTNRYYVGPYINDGYGNYHLSNYL